VSHPKGYVAKRLAYAAVALLILAGIAGVYYIKVRPERDKVSEEMLRERQIPGVEPGAVWAGNIDSGIMDLSRNLADQIIGNRIFKLGVLEFVNNAPGGEILGGDTGCAGRYAAEKVEEGLVKYSQGRYQVVQRQKLDNVAKEIKLQISDLANQESLDKILKQIPGLDALVLGKLTRMGDVLNITAKVLDPQKAINRAIESRKVKVTPDLAALFGESAYRQPDAKGKTAGPAELVSAAINKKAPRLHSPGNEVSDIPYDVRVIIAGEIQTPRVKGGKAYVGAPPGKKYVIDLVNTSEQDVAVALLIDGLNTIGQKRELPSEGRKWVVEAGKTIRIQGWQIGNKTANEFVFTEAQGSLAARKGFYEDIGLITAAFYPEKSKITTRGLVGTGEGEEIKSKVREIRMDYEDTPAAILNLHYDLPAAVQSITSDR
jgi:hypothetical protein